MLIACGSDRAPTELPADAGQDAGHDSGTSPPPSAECGDRRTQDEEECDDGNDSNGDGCGEDCMLEVGFSCPPLGGPCTACGDGQLTGIETCDDGNDESDDGCSDRCELEEGWSCPAPGEVCEQCGNGVLEPNERCDEGDFADAVGCSEDCRTIAENFHCDTVGEACSECGDGEVTGDEVCDDGNVEGSDGCVASCMAIESGWSCPEDGGACALCGDGVLDANEECDDHNFQPNDGCTEACQKESGSVCLQPGVLCSVCGNGFIEFIALNDNATPDDASDDFYDTEDPDALEACDDGNGDDDDGCSAACGLEDGGDLPWSCPLPGVECGRCGDGAVQAIETCDDGVDATSGLPLGADGCSSDCTAIEPGFLCPADGGACVACGDGVLDAPLEACDDHNTLSGDGCNRRCELETDAGWVCPEPGAACELCGNGVEEANEACDDGNAEGADGCAADCQAEEETFNCYFGGFACARCGDAVLQPGEGCDEGHLASPGNKTDGCVDCQRTASWSCPAAGAACELCGDGVIGDGNPLTAFETCDDGNTLASDGCSALCQVEPGYFCNGATCTAASCGDGITATGEECDDGNRNAGDGCSFLCRVEPGFDCSGALGCRRTRCGDGIVEGEEQCDDAGALCSGGAEDGQPCVSEAELVACRDGVGTCAAQSLDGCDSNCALEPGFKCELAGMPCEETACGDGFVEGTEQCDVGGGACDLNGCVALDANGCDVTCALKPGFKCEPGVTCTGANVATDCCVPTVCGDGLVEGSEACDDGPAVSGDGCADDCSIETFYRCSGQPSVCSPIVEYVTIERFRVSNVSPVALTYNPDRRSFGGHKSQGSQTSVELCLDGTVLNQGDKLAGANGTIFSPDNTTSELPPDCSENPGALLCYEAPLRADTVANANVQTLRDGTFDPVSGDYLFTHASQVGTLLVQLPRDMDPNASVDITRFSVQLGFNGYGVTVAENGDLYIVDGDAETLRVLPRLRDSTGTPLPAPDCSALQNPDPATLNCTSFSSTPDAARERAAASDNPLDAIFTLPGESLVSIFNRYTGAPTYDGTDLLSGAVVSNENHFSIYDTESLDAPNRSALPGVLFSLGSEGTSYSNAAQAAETAADGGAFIVCAFTGSQDCQLFARACDTDSDCPPGTLCNLDGVSSVGQAFCNAPGEARDDVFAAERDVYKECVSSGAQNGLDCTADATACVADGGICEQLGSFNPQALDVLANDSLSESACVDPRLTILAVCGDGVAQTYETAHPESCPIDTEPDPIGTVTFDEGGGEITYDAPNDGSCGFFDTFVYTVDLGGGVIDTAQVRVAVNCVCGDGITDGNEQCDDGAFNGAAGTCVERCGGDIADDVLARCGTTCLLNVACGDGYIVTPEECDDRNTANGDGCSAVCTRESVCGNNVTELGEDCDDGPSGSATCNPNCTLPVCGDGNRDLGRGEQCDDGNLRVGDGCNAQCQIETRCGNSVVEPSEDCDDGNTAPGDGCSATCQVENVCGNDLLEGVEVCDGTKSGSCPIIAGQQIECVNSVVGAPNICLCRNYCGDSRIGGTEECDDGEAGSATCRGASPAQGVACSAIRCGDGIVDTSETCDDGNTNPADACTNSCQPRASCGNGTVEAPEECDDRNNISGDGCTSTCQTEARSCGDRVVDADEQCDDGNTASGDGCSNNCRLEGAVCGDRNIDVGEQCDDGNTNSGDGCSSSCRVEVQ